MSGVVIMSQAITEDSEEVSIQDEADSFEKWLNSKTDKSEGSAELYASKVRKLDNPIDFQEQQLEKILQRLEKVLVRGEGRSAFKSYFRFLKATKGYDLDTRMRVNGIITEIDGWNLKTSDGMSKTRVKRKYLTTEEVQKIHTYLRRNVRPSGFRGSKRKTDELKMLPLFLFETACRIEEALNVKIQNIDWDENEIKIPDGKGGKMRTVNINHSKEVLKDHVRKHNIDQDLFAIDREDDYDSLNGKLRRIGNKLYNRSVTSHWFRHSFATNWAILNINEGVPKGKVKEDIRDYLGHGSVDYTECYIGAAEDLERGNIFEDNEFNFQI